MGRRSARWGLGGDEFVHGAFEDGAVLQERFVVGEVGGVGELAEGGDAGAEHGVMWRLTEHGRAGDDPAFAFFEWTAPPGCAPDDEEAWSAREAARCASPATSTPSTST